VHPRGWGEEGEKRMGKDGLVGIKLQLERSKNFCAIAQQGEL
jgi:hypothetical protein